MRKGFAVIIFFCLTVATAFSNDLYFDEAGAYYGISPVLLEAIAMVESSLTVNAVNRNKNGSIDKCHMQINDYWHQYLGDDFNNLDDPWYCSMVGAWVLRLCMERYQYSWEAVACYHTGYSTQDAPNEQKKMNGKKYIAKVQKAVRRIQK